MKIAKEPAVAASLLFTSILVGCNTDDSFSPQLGAADPVAYDTSGPVERYQGNEASVHTASVLEHADANLPIGDFADGSLMSDHNNDVLIAELPDIVGTVDYREFEYLLEDQPGPIHPSLLASAREAYRARGIYRVMDGVYQIRADVAFVTLVRGEEGWIVIDTGIVAEFSEDIWPKVHRLLPGGTAVPISTIIYSHSHADHFGGVKGFVTNEDVTRGNVAVIAPHGFMSHALSENVIAGSAMFRRAQYHFGALLDSKSDGTEFVALGVALKSSAGRYTLITPTNYLPEGHGVVTERSVDGVTMQFMDIGGAEAPSATIIYLPEKKLLFNSELMYRGLHNIYTLRGAEVRDALGWSKAINRVIHEWGDEVEHIIGPHGPSFSGNDKILEFMRAQRDNYGFIHSQSVRLINNGMKLQDVGPAIEAMVPTSLSRLWHTHGYHGTYSHNARGVVNRYLGFYDGNPANLNPLPLAEESVKFVEYMGGAEALMERASKDIADGQYRFAATALNKLVTADPDHWPARHLLADTFEQLGYQSEGPQWRNAYISAAKELRTGVIREPMKRGLQLDLLAAATTEDILDSIAVRLNSEKAEDTEMTMTISISDRDEHWYLELMHGNLSYIRTFKPKSSDLSLNLLREDFVRLFTGQLTAPELVRLGVNAFQGSPLKLAKFLSSLQPDNQYFSIVPMPGDD